MSCGSNCSDTIIKTVWNCQNQCGLCGFKLKWKTALGKMVYLCLCGYRKLNWRFVSCSKVYIIKIKSYTLCVRGLVYCFRV